MSVSNVQKLKGPFEWSDALSTDKQGKLLVTHSEENFSLAVWNLKEEFKAQPVTLSGIFCILIYPCFLWVNAPELSMKLLINLLLVKKLLN